MRFGGGQGADGESVGASETDLIAQLVSSSHPRPRHQNRAWIEK